MKLLAKFNMILGIILCAGLFYTARVAYLDMQDSARHQQEIDKQQIETQAKLMARLMMAAAQATRDYTAKEIKPLLMPDKPAQQKDAGPNSAGEAAPKFYHEAVPAYAARKTFEHFKDRMAKSEAESLKKQDMPNEKFQEILEGKLYTYKEASDKPTNHENNCDDFEKQLIDYFRTSGSKPEIFQHYLGVEGKNYWVLAQPIKCDQKCLSCHDTPDSPEAKAMIESDPQNYNQTGGFGWKVDHVVAVKMVKIPMSEVEEPPANSMHTTLIWNLVGVTIGTMVSLNVGLIWLIIRPVTRLSSWAEDVSTGELSLGRIPVKGKDEIATLTESFNRMYISLLSAMNMLKKNRK